ncbi:nucleoside triphosphate pyrophosphohydrolase [Ferroacidibacillus organovorans]|uniref:MazG family protein n=1 Tax=Ferroacidibacillus organovorans TaxID=1765683 RepID=A0A101XRW3_9BACL|nr:nucleoside triphosphate pyrophosphohydrolase [Ferroacidibacillus organovorans]KUO96402.1 MazG family protein [Ferroacidibacillus organovorans]
MGRLTVIGLGAGALDALPLGAYRRLLASNAVYLRTDRHPVVDDLRREGVLFQSFDAIYDQADDFDEVYTKIVEELVAATAERGEVLYAVPGHPAVAEKTVRLLRERIPSAGHELVFGPGQSFLDDLFLRIDVDPVEGVLLLDATDLAARQLNPRLHTVLLQMYNPMIANEVKITLAEVYGDAYEILLAQSVGVAGQERMQRIPVYQLDRLETIDHLTTLYVPPSMDAHLLRRQFHELRAIVARLRGPDGCPWDQEQTHLSLCRYAIEEAYEVAHAIEQDDPDALVDELGDLLLQVALHAEIGAEDGLFTMDDIIGHLNEKLIRRHPHVFTEQTTLTSDEVISNWQAIKAEERRKKGTEHVTWMDRVSRALPPFAQAIKLQARAAEAGFDFTDAVQIYAKVDEEVRELSEARGMDEREDEFGDILFSLLNLARFYEIDPESALKRANLKFRARFDHMEQAAGEKNLEIRGLSLDLLEKLWQNAKENMRNEGNTLTDSE